MKFADSNRLLGLPGQAVERPGGPPNVLPSGRNKFPVTFWTSARLDILRTLRDAGWRTRDQAAFFGVSRGSVTGAAWRAGMPKRESPVPSIPASPGVAFKDLAPNGCRFPIDHAIWCGAPAKPGSSFCPTHHLRCYRTETPETKP